MARFTCRDRTTGRVKVDSDTPSLLFFGRVQIGGAGSAQSGQITDDRFAWGEAVVFPVFAEFTGTEGLEPTMTVTGSVLTWRYPMPGSTARERPVVSFMYGVQP